MNLLKIAKILVSEYKYIYDPDHLQHPSGEFHKTDDGWSNKKERKKDWENVIDKTKLNLENLYENIKDLDSIDENSLKEALKDYSLFSKGIIKKLFDKYNLYDPDSFKEFKQYLYDNFGKKLEDFELLDSNIGGSTGAKLYKDGNGNKFVIKTYHGNVSQVKNELLANKLYKLFGVNVPDSKMVNIDGKIGIANSYIDGLTKFTDEDKSSDKFKKQVLDKFVIDALLANWDTVGLTFDNLLKDKNGNFYRIDNGGALLYRAQGEPKGAAFGKKVLELDSLRNPNINSSSANVFSALTNEDIVKQIESIDDSVKEKIKDIIKDIYKDDDIDTKLPIFITITERLDNMREWAKEKKEENMYTSENMGSGKPFPDSKIPDLIDNKKSHKLINEFKNFWDRQFKNNTSTFALWRNLFSKLPHDKSLSEQKKVVEENLQNQISQDQNFSSAYREIFKIVSNYSGPGYSYESDLSYLVKETEGYNSPDYRMMKYHSNHDTITPDMKKMFKLFREKEQEFLLHSGLVDEDGYLYLFRSSDQVPEQDKEHENIWKYNGGYAESWTYYPSGYDSNITTYMARIHYSQVIASSIGNDEIDLFKHPGEGEIIIDASKIGSVIKLDGEHRESINQEYANQIKENLENINNIIKKQKKLKGKINKKLKKLDFIENPTEQELEILNNLFPELKENNSSVTDNILIYKLMIKHNPDFRELINELKNEKKETELSNKPESFSDNENSDGKNLTVDKLDKVEDKNLEKYDLKEIFNDKYFGINDLSDNKTVKEFKDKKEQIIHDMCKEFGDYINKEFSVQAIYDIIKLNKPSKYKMLLSVYKTEIKPSNYKDWFSYVKAKNFFDNMKPIEFKKFLEYVNENPVKDSTENKQEQEQEKPKQKEENKPKKRKYKIKDFDSVFDLFTDDLFGVDLDDKLEMEKLNERKKDIVNDTCNELGEFKNKQKHITGPWRRKSLSEIKAEFLKNMNPSKYKDQYSFNKAKLAIQNMSLTNFEILYKSILLDEEEDEEDVLK